MKALRSQSRAKAFTLLELVVVMTLLSVVLAIAAPRLAGFMSGRDFREEARRILSLVRHGQSEAISRGQRVEVWFKPETGEYGARTDAVESDENPLAIQFTCREGLTLGIDPDALDDEGEATIVFWPDGTVDSEAVDRVELIENQKATMALVRPETGTGYVLEEVQNEPQS